MLLKHASVSSRLPAFRASHGGSDRVSAVASILAAVTLLLASSSVDAQTRFEEDFDDTTKAWQEVAIQLPAPPAAENLLPFNVSATATQAFAIDAKSVTVGTDGVIRYTLVAKSPEGATNVSYEGIRCESFERKLYAFGRPDGNWSRSRHDQWARINSGAANRQHAALARDYFCNEKSVAGKAEEMVERIRRQRPLVAEYNR